MVLSGFRVYPYRLPHLEEKDGPFFDTFLALLVVLISATVVYYALFVGTGLIYYALFVGTGLIYYALFVGTGLIYYAPILKLWQGNTLGQRYEI